MARNFKFPCPKCNNEVVIPLAQLKKIDSSFFTICPGCKHKIKEKYIFTQSLDLFAKIIRKYK